MGYISHNILNLLFIFLKESLKGEASSLADVDAWVPQGSTFGPLLLLIYMNNLNDNLSNIKLFAADTSLFSVVYNVNTSADGINIDLIKIK